MKMKKFSLPKPGAFSYNSNKPEKELTGKITDINKKDTTRTEDTRRSTTNKTVTAQTDRSPRRIDWGVDKNENIYVTTNERYFREYEKKDMNTKEKRSVSPVEQLSKTLIPYSQMEYKRIKKPGEFNNAEKHEVKTFFDNFGHNEREKSQGKKHVRQEKSRSKSPEILRYHEDVLLTKSSKPNFSNVLKSLYDFQAELDTDQSKFNIADRKNAKKLMHSPHKPDYAGVSNLNYKEKSKSPNRDYQNTSLMYKILSQDKSVQEPQTPPRPHKKLITESNSKKTQPWVELETLKLIERNTRREKKKVDTWERRNKSANMERALQFPEENIQSLSSKMKNSSPMRAKSPQTGYNIINHEVNTRRSNVSPKAALHDLRSAVKPHENFANILRHPGAQNGHFESDYGRNNTSQSSFRSKSIPYRL